ncbi:hypothetical protein GCM10027610_134270 [Dactylosporangium cerinum]
MRAHEAGALHGDLGFSGPSWLRTPQDVNALVPQLWSKTVERTASGEMAVGGVNVRKIAEQHGTPAYVFDEADFRARCKAFKEAFGGAEVFYAGKAFIATAVVRILVEEGLSLDVCTGGELAVALRGGMPPERIGLHGNNKSVAELTRAVEAGVGRIIVDSFDEIDRLTAIAESTNTRPKVMVRVTVGVEAHTHEYIATAHEDQKFGFSLSGEPPPRPSTRFSLNRNSSSAACTRTSARRSSTRPGSRSRPGGCCRCRPPSTRSTRSSCPSWTSAAGSASRTRPRTRRPSRGTWPRT